MSKFRLELRPSRLLVVFQVLTYIALIASVYIWQPNVIPYQTLAQSVLVIIISLWVFKYIWQSHYQKLPVIIVSQEGGWLEIAEKQQTSWKVSKESRVTSLVLFMYLESLVDVKHSKRTMIFRDQLEERDYRRLCRTIFFQQQLT